MAAEPSKAVVPIRQTQQAERLAVAPFASWTYEDAVAALGLLKPRDFDEQYEITRAYGMDRNHWRDGDEWVGPGDSSTNTKIAEQFAPDDAIGEVLANVGNAFSEPHIGFAPLEEFEDGKIPAEIQRKIEEASAWVSEWWDKQRAQEAVQNRLHTSAWSGRAALRLWVPGRFLLRSGDTVRTLEAKDVREALAMIYLSAPDPANCGIVTDPDTQEKCAVFIGDKDEEANGKKNTVRWAELVYLDPDATENPKTIVRKVYEGGSDGEEYVSEMALGGRLLAAEMRVPSLLTDPVIRTQRQLNFLSSIITRIGETAAFRERYIYNAVPQGTRTPYTDGQTIPSGAFTETDDQGRAWLVEPAERTLGANTTNELVGLPTITQTTTGTTTGRETPQVEVFDPVDPMPYVQTAEAVRAKILRMCHQGHLANTATAESSGMAYEQARSAFAKDLNRRRSAEEGMLREIITADLALAEYIADDPGYFTDVLRVTVDQYVDAGPRSPDAARSDMEAHDQGLLSKETAMSRLGVEDVDAEIGRLESGAAYLMDLLKEASEASAVFSADQVIRALEAAGVPQEIIAAMRPQDTDDLPEGGQ